ncbi:hypothetical protein Tco_1446987 [Tanacetum coccineum]
MCTRRGYMERTKNMLTGKWTPMNANVQKFNQLVEETLVHSGENDEDWMTRVEILNRLRVTDEEPEHFKEDGLPRPPEAQRIAKSQRSSNSTASSGSNPLMYQELMKGQYELDRKAKMEVIERETNERMRLYHSQRIAEDMKVLQIDTRGMDPIDAAIVNAQKARVKGFLVPTAPDFATNSIRMERQMLVHFEREMDANHVDARELMRLIVEVEERMNHMASLIKEVEILTGSISAVEDDKGKLTGIDKGKLTRIECVGNLEKRIQNVENVLYKGKKQMLMEKGKKETNEFLSKLSSDEDSTTNEDSSFDDHMIVFKGKTGSSSKLSKAKTRSSSKSILAKKATRSKHLIASEGSKKAYVRASARSKTLLPTKRPPLTRNFILGLAAVSTYAKILNKEFGIRNPKDDVAASADVARKEKKKMV